MKRRHVERFLEFLVIGVALGVVEDAIAVKVATGAEIDAGVIGVIFLVAVPFAALSELVVDRQDFGIFRRLAEKVRSDDQPRRKPR
ncbi:MAG: hypothetical protein SVS85_02835 [Candidatus Nanohaloarchaea archaeon]|nr:hypothetical protein [Candidatus Nanohaloarchaea archaeon]